MKWMLMMIYPCMLIVFHLFLFTQVKAYHDTVIKYKKVLFVSLGLFVILLNVLFLIYFHIEDTIYFWDYAGFWTKTMDFLDVIDLQGGRVALSTLYQSMLYSEHSYLLCLFLSLPMKLFGKSFLVYVLSVLNYFVIPFMCNMLVLMLALFDKYEMKGSPLAITLSILFFFPIYAVLFKGYADSAGLLFIIILLILEFLNEKESWIVNLLCSFLCFILIFLRRWYLFWVVGYFASLLVVLIFSKDVKTIRKAILDVLKKGLPLLIVFVLFFRPYLLNLFTNDLATAYSAYKIDGFMNEVIHDVSFYGTLVLLIASIGIYQGIRTAKKESLFVLTQLAIVFFLFLKIQSMDEHHFHLLNTGILFFVLMGMTLIKKRNVLFILVLIVNVIHCLSPLNESRLHNVMNYLFSNVTKVPEVLEYKQEMIMLAEKINELCSQQSYAYFSASSLEMNADVLRNSKLPEIRNAVPNLVNTSDVDLRDGFPKNYSSIMYVVVVNPVQYHMMNPDDQSINALINEAVQNVQEVKKHYQVVDSRVIDRKEVKIYKRVSELDNDAKNYFVKEILKLYPNRHDLLHGIDE